MDGEVKEEKERGCDSQDDLLVVMRSFIHIFQISQRFPAGVTREGTGVRKFTRSNSIDTIKLPGVNLGSTYAQAARRRQPIPVKTFNMKVSYIYAAKAHFDFFRKES